jgi:hypothetical protein
MDGKHVWGLHDEEVLIGFASIVSVALENLKCAKEPAASNL